MSNKNDPAWILLNLIILIIGLAFFGVLGVFLF